MPEQLMSCPVCHNESVDLFAKAYDKEYFTSGAEYQYAHCTRCTAVYLDSPPADRLDEIYPPNYYSYGGIEGSTSVTERVKEWLDVRMFRKLLSGIAGHKLAVLDVGGGAGWLLNTIRAADSRVVETHEVDMQAEAAVVAEAAGHVYHRTRIENFETDRRFDLILMMSIIEHVPDPRATLSAVSELLTEDGILVVKTPNTSTVDCRLFQHRNWGGFHCPRHFVLFTADGLENVAAECGLETVRRKYTQGAPQWTLSVMSWLHDRGLITVTSDQPAYTHRVYEPLTALFAVVDLVRSWFAPTAQMILQFRRHRHGRPDPEGGER